MLYLIFGTDTEKSRRKLHELLDSAQKKRPGSELFRMNTESWVEGRFDELVVSQGLFEQKYTVVLDNLFERKEVKDYVLDRIKEVAESKQVFLMLESKIDAATLTKIKKVAKQVQEFEKKDEDKFRKPTGSIFSIADGLVSKDKKKLWTKFIDFIYKGTAPEEIHGIFFWQVKNMIISLKSSTLAETGLSPFVYKNALNGSKNYKIEELQNMSSDLVQMTHRVRQGEGDLEIMLEKWILSL